MKTIKEDWESYRAILPANASETQIVETRRAFYSGAWVALNLVEQVGAASVTEAQGVAYIEGLMQECRDFNEDVKNERA